MRHINPSRVGQRGAALAIGLILLAVTSLVTITSINTSVMQERMAANQDNHARAFMAAEAGGASLVTWIRTNGWPTASNRPPLQSNVIAGNPSITFTLSLHTPSISWANSPLNVLIEGRALSADGNAVLARTQLLVTLEPAPGRSFDAPAAISCFGGPCRVRAGAGGGADQGFGLISGFDHPIPDLDCRGDSCRVLPQNPDRIRIQTQTERVTAMPAVFLQNPIINSIDTQGGGNPFQGLHPTASNPIITITGNDLRVAKSPSHYLPDPITRVSTVPTLNSVFGVPVPPATSSVPTTTRLESNRATPTFASAPPHNVRAEVGTFVINGGSFDIKGTDMFVGLIVIRNCGTLSVSGNPNIYGAVIVEAMRADGTPCPDYTPFTGNGTPALRFSRDALHRAANPPSPVTGAVTGLNVLRWTEILQ